MLRVPSPAKQRTRFVVMEGPPADYPSLFRAAAEKLGFQAEIDSYPHIAPAHLTRAKLADIENLLKRRADDGIILFCPGALEHFVEGADMSFQFSAYRSWFDSSTTTVIPHPWTLTWHLADRDSLRWRTKPPCNIGFMGAAYRRARRARVAAAVPQLRSWIRAGGLVRNAHRAACMDELRIRSRYVPTFIRREILEAVESAPDESGLSQVSIIDTEGGNFAPWHRDEFAQHMAETTYVLCPRGCENYSYRAYEALRFGRVPVIIDSDMVLPSSIDWQEVGIIVPDGCSDSVRARIVDDYRSRDAAAFLKRQEAAFRTSDYLDGDDWLADCILEAVHKLGVAPPER